MAAEYDLVPFGPAPCSTCYISWDHLGSTRMITGPSASSGAVSYHDYMPFATEIPAGYDARTSTWGATDDVNQKFTGKERDAEIGLDYFGARYYGSALGRFTGPDEPFADQHPEDPQSWNLYAYVRNNPMKNTDPNGRDCSEGVSSCANYILGGLMAVGNVPTDLINAPDRALNLLLSPFTSFRVADAVSPSFTPSNQDQAEGMNAANAVMMVSPLSELGAANATTAAAEVPLITRNAIQGSAFQNAVAADTALTDRNVVQNITVRTQSGVRTQLDVVSTNPAGNIALKEAKSSATAPLTPAQAAAHPEIAQTGATVVGKGKPPFVRGTQIPPTQAQVVRPPCSGTGCPN